MRIIILFAPILNNLAKEINHLLDILHKYGTLKMNDFILKCLDSISEGISICDKDGNIVYVNKACCNMIGADRRELIENKIECFTDNSLLLEILKSKKSITKNDYFMKFNPEGLAIEGFQSWHGICNIKNNNKREEST